MNDREDLKEKIDQSTKEILDKCQDIYNFLQEGMEGISQREKEKSLRMKKHGQS